MGPKDTGPKDISAKDSGPKVVVAKGAAPEDVAPRDGAPKGTGPAPAEPRQPDTQRIIAMPSRQPSAAPGAGTAAGPTMNGASVSPFGSRPAPGAPQAARPAMREADDVMAKVAEKVSDRIAGRGPDAGLHGPAQAGAPPAPTRAEVPREQPTPERETTGPFAGAASAANRSEEGPSPESNAAKPASARAPSEALIDAVVDLVHREPDSLSVFTSGSAFIHGVTGHEPHADKPAVSTRKLDRSAAELLRPMLRQWLADNMPRIVEEALRSELMSSQADADSEET
jgi:cell pole-organizing protein PopZ